MAVITSCRRHLILLDFAVIALHDPLAAIVDVDVGQPAAFVTDSAAVDAFILTFAIGTICTGVLLSPLLLQFAQPTMAARPAAPALPRHLSALACGTLFLVTFGAEAPWLAYVLGENPFQWLATFMGASWIRAAVPLYWAACLVLVVAFAPNDRSSQLPNIIVRKFFHLVALVMFVPVILVDVRDRNAVVNVA
jgi:hypothetical protein